MPKFLIHIAPEKEAFFLELLAQLEAVQAVERVGENEKKSEDATRLPPSWTLSVAEQEKHYVPFAQREIPDFVQKFTQASPPKDYLQTPSLQKPKGMPATTPFTKEEAEEAWRFLEDDY